MMIIYNTTYTVSSGDAKNFIIWINEAYIPKAQEDGILKKARLLQILTHKDPDTECFSLQFEAESVGLLQKWYVQKGKVLVEEMLKLFGEKVVGFSTIMNDVTLEMKSL